VWLAIEARFLGNHETHVLHLDEQFRAFKQDCLSISNYCCKMKDMADKIRSLGEELSNHHLILQLLCGFSKKYDHMAAFIKHTKPHLVLGG
jgi:hypothetical protein